MLHGPWILSIRDHHFFAAPIDAQSIVVDLGAHLGEFSTEISRRFGCRCYGAEPHPGLFSRICQTDRVSILNAAIASIDAPVKFNISAFAEANSLRALPRSGVNSTTVNGITFQSFMAAWGIDHINLMKVDIEGAEIELFGAMSDELLHRIDQITVEFHDFLPEFNLSAKVRATLDRLTGLGWIPIVFSRRDHSDVLLINRKKLSLSSIQLFYFSYLARYVEGMLRIIQRAAGLGGRRRPPLSNPADVSPISPVGSRLDPH
jgi:FkbM family methyltransferase